jgi:hypothetical protein
MKVEHRLYCPESGWQLPTGTLAGLRPHFAIVFGPRDLVADPAVLSKLKAAYPEAHLLIGSSSGDISDISLSDRRVAVTAVALERSSIRCGRVAIGARADSREAGRKLARQLFGPDLAHVFILADGCVVNGTQLALGLNEILPATTTVTGGLAGDGTSFEQTSVGLDEAPASNRIAAIGLYGRHLEVGYGSSGGWVPFGPERRVTRANDNVLHELDGQSALTLYRKYLGEAAAGLPASALRFPLWIQPEDGGVSVVRTPHRIDDENGSIEFAGDIPERARVRFLRASYDELIDGAGRAAEQATKEMADPELTICVSCVARRIVLGQRTEEELERVREIVGERTALCGFYSYGELAPINGDPSCRFHNQTMTITTLREEPS